MHIFITPLVSLCIAMPYIRLFCHKICENRGKSNFTILQAQVIFLRFKISTCAQYQKRKTSAHYMFSEIEMIGIVYVIL